MSQIIRPFTVDAVVNHGSTPMQAYRGLINVAPGHEVHGEGW